MKSISPDLAASAAVRELAAAGVRRLLVMDSDGALVGVLSRRDLLKLFVREDVEFTIEPVRAGAVDGGSGSFGLGCREPGGRSD